MCQKTRLCGVSHGQLCILIHSLSLLNLYQIHIIFVSSVGRYSYIHGEVDVWNCPSAIVKLSARTLEMTSNKMDEEKIGQACGKNSICLLDASFQIVTYSGYGEEILCAKFFPTSLPEVDTALLLGMHKYVSLVLWEHDKPTVQFNTI